MGRSVGPPPQEQVDATLQWVTDVFREHYRQEPPPLPPRHGRREFGFLWTGKKFFLRHVGFGSQAAFHDFLAHEAPHHCYYSTAYYKTPHAATMKEKEWLGADLIFDLDADHLPNADKMTFAEQLAEVKKQARKLLHEFLLGDFGFSEEHVRVVFSGGRGYHFHVNDPRVLQLDSAARREIVDYISPNDIISKTLAETWAVERTLVKDKFGHGKKEKFVAAATTPGWTGRLTRTIVEYLTELHAQPRPQAIKELCTMEGIGPKTAESVLDWSTPEQLSRLSSGGIFDYVPGHLVGSDVRDTGSFSNRVFVPPALQKESVVRGLVEKAKIRAQGETDEPVTADVKRLIRLPGSLHGKTGLRVTPMGIAEFERFDPLRDAVALGDEPTRVVVSKPMVVPLKGRTLHVEPGEQDLPLYAAMFVTLRRGALRPLPATA